MNIKIKGVEFLSFFISLLVVSVLFYIYKDISIYSDNYYYKEAFEYKSVGFVDYYRFFLWRTAGSEPLSILYFYFFSFFLNYESFIFLTDFLFTFLLVRLFLLKNIPVLVILVLLFTCSYYQVLIIGIHRFKIALLYLLIITNMKFTSIKKSIFLVLSPLFHAQSVIILFSYMIIQMKLKKVQVKGVIVYILVFCVVSYFLIFNTSFIQKATSRIQYDYISLLVNAALILIFSIFFRVRSFSFYMCSIFISLSAFVFGGFRINMVLYGYFLFFLVRSPKSFSLFVIITTPFMLFKTMKLYQHYLNNLIG